MNITCTVHEIQCGQEGGRKDRKSEKNHTHMKKVEHDHQIGAIFAFLPHLWPKKSKFLKDEKNAWRYYGVTYVYQKS